MNYLIKQGIDANIISNKKQLKDISMSQKVYEYAYPLLLKTLYDESKIPKRPNDININTLGNRMVAKKIA